MAAQAAAENGVGRWNPQQVRPVISEVRSLPRNGEPSPPGSRSAPMVGARAPKSKGRAPPHQAVGSPFSPTCGQSRSASDHSAAFIAASKSARSLAGASRDADAAAGGPLSRCRGLDWEPSWTSQRPDQSHFAFLAYGGLGGRRASGGRARSRRWRGSYGTAPAGGLGPPPAARRRVPPHGSRGSLQPSSWLGAAVRSCPRGRNSAPSGHPLSEA
jgi:hypothetical protein